MGKKTSSRITRTKYGGSVQRRKGRKKKVFQKNKQGLEA